VTGLVAGRTGAPRMTHYAAARWGVVGLVKSAALELGPLGITVNALAPPFTNTPMIHNERNYRQFSPDDPTPTGATAAWERLMPMRIPYVEPEEVRTPCQAAASACSMSRRWSQVPAMLIDHHFPGAGTTECMTSRKKGSPLWNPGNLHRRAIA
jgi:NAD(P)-dependent dehydrogenase (short-subunit alcohol dehydrogenase family)